MLPLPLLLLLGSKLGLRQTGSGASTRQATAEAYDTDESDRERQALDWALPVARLGRRARVAGRVGQAPLADAPYEPELVPRLPRARLLECMQQQCDRVAATDGVVEGVLVPGEPVGVLSLDQRHTLAVQGFDGLEDLARAGVLVRELEPPAPVAKIGRDDEEGLGLKQVRSQHTAVLRFCVLVESADQYGHDAEGPVAHDVHHIRQVHLDRVLGLVHGYVHYVECAGGTELVGRCCVQRKVTQRRGVGGAAGDAAAWSVVVVARADNEDTRDSGRLHVLVCPGRGRARVRVSRVRSDDSPRRAAALVRLLEPAGELRGKLLPPLRVPRARVRRAAGGHHKLVLVADGRRPRPSISKLGRAPKQNDSALGRASAKRQTRAASPARSAAEARWRRPVARWQVARRPSVRPRRSTRRGRRILWRRSRKTCGASPRLTPARLLALSSSKPVQPTQPPPLRAAVAAKPAGE
eukprot:scaffold12977_cov119-Isochrysis_galbana.AAC.4